MKDNENMKYNICMSTDDHYAHILATAIVSLLENNKKIKFCFWILTTNLSEQNKKKIKNISKDYCVDIEFIDLNDKLHFLKKIGLPSWNNNSYATYSRLFIADVLPDNIDRVLYLDSDVLVVDEISELLNYKFQNGKVIIGTLDIVGSFNVKYLESLGLKEYHYINAGVILINLQLWREKNISERIIKHLTQERYIYNFVDQDIINVVLENEIQIVSPKYDLFSNLRPFSTQQVFSMFRLDDKNTYYDCKYFETERKKPIIIHFVGLIFYRPWYVNTNNPYKKEWCSYYQKTDYGQIKLPRRKDRGMFKLIAFFYAIMPVSVFSFLYEKMRFFLKKIKRG